MFVLCPHCQFLVAIDAASGQPPRRCPRCRKLLQQAVASADPDAGSGEADAAPVAATPAAEPPPVAEPPAGEPHAVELPAVEPPAVEPEVGAAPAGEPQPIDDATTAVAADGVATPDAPSPAPGSEDANTIEADATPATVAPAAAGPKPSRKRSRTATANQKPRAKPRASRSKTASVAAVAAPAIPPEGAPAPGFVQRQRVRIARSSHTQRWMIAAIALLSLLLLLQLLLADRANLARDARWRAAMTALCGALRCTLPAWREPAAFTLLDRDVRPRPGMPGVLRVTATFRNDARWPQPWPALLLTLSDLDGRAAGARVFTPREYLGAAPTQSTLASGQSAMLSMDVLEPGPRIVAFTFDFR
jgi:hypothetical protein